MSISIKASRILGLIVILLLSNLLIVPVIPVSAASIVVDTFEDQNNTDIEHCSLREAIKAADTDAAYGGCPAGSGADIITLNAGVYTVGSSLVDYTSTDITIIGVSPATTIIQASSCDPTVETCTNDHQFVWVSAGTLTLTNLTFRYWKNTGDLNGGVLLNQSTLNITNCVFYANRAARGGALTNSSSGNLSIINSTFSSNMAKNESAYMDGGAIYNTTTGTISVEDSTFTENEADRGGGIFNFGTQGILNSTFSGNSAESYGGGVLNAGTTTLTNSTFTENSGTTGAGIYNYSGYTLNYTNTIIANSIIGGDCYNSGTIGTNLNNLVEDNSCSPMYSGDPNLGTLADNGGPTQTHELITGSNAIDNGNLAACPATDQRGVDRPQGEGCDIGAYEREPITPVYLPLILRQ